MKSLIIASAIALSYVIFWSYMDYRVKRAALKRPGVIKYRKPTINWHSFLVILAFVPTLSFSEVLTKTSSAISIVIFCSIILIVFLQYLMQYFGLPNSIELKDGKIRMVGFMSFFPVTAHSVRRIYYHYLNGSVSLLGDSVLIIDKSNLDEEGFDKIMLFLDEERGLEHIQIAKELESSVLRLSKT